MKNFLVILGQTATGKTDLALLLAKKFNGEIISCDSRQVYTNLDIGTGKYPNLNIKYQISNIKKRKGYWIIDGISIQMYDVVDPKKQYSVADYVKDATKVIADINKRGKLPIIVGGTGLYLKALLYGLSNLAIPVDKHLRKKLQKLSKEDLQSKLKEISLRKWESMNSSDRENPRRLVRAIELETSPRRSPYGHLRGVATSFKTLKVGLIAPGDVLYQRVDERVVKRINQGMIEEAKKLNKNGLSLKRMKALGLEYGVLADYLSGKIRKIKGDQGLVKIMQNKIHRFVRRQLTWFNKEKDVHWFDVDERMVVGRIENLVRQWYDISV